MTTSKVSSTDHKEAGHKEAEGCDWTSEMVCPLCHSGLTGSGDTLFCDNPACRTEFPVVDGVPVLINESRSLFSISDFVTHGDTFFRMCIKSRSRPPSVLTW